MLRVVIASLLVLGTAHAKNRLACADLPDLMNRYLAAHVTQPSLDRALAERVATLYVGSLDPAKVLLLEKDAEALHTQLADFVLSSRSGKLDCTLLDKTASDEIAWQKAMEAYIGKQLADKAFAIDTDLRFTVDADKRQRGKDGEGTR